MMHRSGILNAQVTAKLTDNEEAVLLCMLVWFTLV